MHLADRQVCNLIHEYGNLGQAKMWNAAQAKI